MTKTQKFISETKKRAKELGLDIFVVVSDQETRKGASGTSVTEDGGVIRLHRKVQIDWEKENGIDPDHDWRNG